MNIIKLPVPLKVNCECGCDFVFDIDDLEVKTIFVRNHEYKWINVTCPFCQKVHTLKKIDTLYECNPQN